MGHLVLTVLFAVVLIILLLCFVQGSLINPTPLFDRFFPAWDPEIQDIIATNCTAQFTEYKGGDAHRAFQVVQCVLINLPEFRKAEMAASTVILGLLPTILQGLGSTFAETSLLGLRRQGLASLCAAGSPAFAGMTGGEFSKTILEFMAEGRMPMMERLRDKRARSSPWISVLEYVVVGGAAANVMALTYQLSIYSAAVFSPGTTWMLPLWTALALVIHVAGVVALRLRVHLKPQGHQGEKRGSVSRALEGGFDDLTPSAFQPQKTLVIYKEETLWFHALTWVLNIGIVIHMVFGTLIMSSLLFLSVLDSVGVVARYAVSSIACRAVLRFELTGMRISVKKDEGEGLKPLMIQCRETESQ